MRDAKKTQHPGIRRESENSYLVRVTVTDPGGKKRDKEERVEGTLSDAIRAREDLREPLRAEVEREAKQRDLGLDPNITKREILSAYAPRWIEHLVKTGRNRVHVIDQHRRVLDKFVLPTLGRLSFARSRGVTLPSGWKPSAT